MTGIHPEDCTVWMLFKHCKGDERERLKLDLLDWKQRYDRDEVKRRLEERLFDIAMDDWDARLEQAYLDRWELEFDNKRS